jgi:hypothetical protein
MGVNDLSALLWRGREIISALTGKPNYSVWPSDFVTLTGSEGVLQ